MRAKNTPDILRARAFVTLGRTARDPAHTAVLREGASRASGLPARVRAAAALGIGLLRRTRSEWRFDAPVLEACRQTLLEILESKDEKTRTRGHAALALGLLGDQPYAVRDGARALTARLFSLLHLRADVDLLVGTLLAIRLQSEASVTATQRGLLRRWMSAASNAATGVASYAALALGHVGGEGDVAALQKGLRGPVSGDLNVARSCAVALGQLACRLRGTARVRAVRGLEAGVSATQDRTARHLGLISLAHALAADAGQRQDGRPVSRRTVPAGAGGTRAWRGARGGRGGPGIDWTRHHRGDVHRSGGRAPRREPSCASRGLERRLSALARALGFRHGPGTAS